jgi:hypothetical protein
MEELHMKKVLVTLIALAFAGNVIASEKAATPATPAAPAAPAAEKK